MLFKFIPEERRQSCYSSSITYLGHMVINKKDKWVFIKDKYLGRNLTAEEIEDIDLELDRLNGYHRSIEFTDMRLVV